MFVWSDVGETRNMCRPAIIKNSQYQILRRSDLIMGPSGLFLMAARSSRQSFLRAKRYTHKKKKKNY